MAEDINKVLLVGRLTRDAELSYTNSGYALCKFSIAVNRRKKQGDNWIDEANFFELTLWGKRAESLNQYLTKGVQIACEGQLKQERWEQDGQKRSKVSVEAVNIQLLGGKSNNDQSNNSGGNPSNGYQQQGQQNRGTNQSTNSQQSFESYQPPSRPAQDQYEDDIPF
ncbi:MAG: single-stranded DNA-binding protein [Spirochaetales bacterium]|nr:single-stranded DNA-binding protein [Spirochaetales bacterium]